MTIVILIGILADHLLERCHCRRINVSEGIQVEVKAHVCVCVCVLVGVGPELLRRENREQTLPVDAFYIQ